ncbi:MAG: hypothetical protein R3D45_09265 [Rhizobiaceae bacterium]
MPDEAKPAESADKPPETKEAQAYKPNWTEPVFRYGILVGMLFTFAGLMIQSFVPAIPQLSSSLLLVSGLGIVFGAFGANAVVKTKGIIVGGVAAIALIFFLVFQNIIQKEIVVLRISGNEDIDNVQLLASERIPGSDRDDYFEFRLFRDEIDVANLILSLTPPEGPPDIEFHCIPKKALIEGFGRGERLVWRFHRDTETLEGVGGAGVVIAKGPCTGTGPVPVDTPPDDRPGFTLLDWPWSITPAFAAPSIPAMLADLESNDVAERRDARQALAAQGLAAVEPMMRYWAAKPDVYRVRLGVSVALTEFLRRHKNERKQVSRILQVVDLQALTEAAADKDRTLRVYASEFLYDLGDPRSIAAADRVFFRSTENGQYNLALVAVGSVGDVAVPDRRDTARILNGWRARAAAKTRALIDKALGGLR